MGFILLFLWDSSCRSYSFLTMRRTHVGFPCRGLRTSAGTGDSNTPDISVLFEDLSIFSSPVRDSSIFAQRVFSTVARHLVGQIQPYRNKIVVNTAGDDNLKAFAAQLYVPETYKYPLPANSVEQILSYVTTFMDGEAISGLLELGLDPALFEQCSGRVKNIAALCNPDTGSFAGLVRRQYWYAAFNRMRRSVANFLDTENGSDALQYSQVLRHWGLELEINYRYKGRASTEADVPIKKGALELVEYRDFDPLKMAQQQEHPLVDLRFVPRQSQSEGF